jgi:hypothetical protein
MKKILARGNELRFSKEIQDLYTEKDDTNWYLTFIPIILNGISIINDDINRSAKVTNGMYARVLREFGFEDSERYVCLWFRLLTLLINAKCRTIGCLIKYILRVGSTATIQK